MCGLVGLAGKVTDKERKAFKLLLQFDTDRGPHSTGLCAVDYKGEPSIFKEVGTPWEVYQHKRWDTVFNPVANVFIGHNRWATKGKINKVNAHPFEHGDITGCHNGTLKAQWKLTDHTKFDVDSENIIYNIDLEGVQATIPKLDGAYALTWWNRKEKSLNMIRNAERPLYFVFSEDNKTLFWASEKWMLHISLGIVGIKHHNVAEVETDLWYKFVVPMGASGTAKVFKDYANEKLEGFTAPPYQYPIYSGPSGGTGSGYRSGGKSRTRDASPHVKLVAGPRDLEKWVGSRVDVSIDSKTMGNHPYFSCKLIIDPRIHVRIHAEYNSALWKELDGVKANEFAKVKVKRITTMTRGTKTFSYLVADLRGVEVVGYAAEFEKAQKADAKALKDSGEELCDYNGRRMSVKRFNTATSKGCAWCADPIMISQAGDIAWLSIDEFVCSKCVDLPDVKEHMNAL